MPLGEHGQQHGEVDGSRGVGEHLLQFLLGGDAAQLVVGGAKVALAKDAILVAIHQLESLLELGHLLLAEHGEDVAAGASGGRLARATSRAGLGRAGSRSGGGRGGSGSSLSGGFLFLLLLLLLLLNITLAK